MFYFTLVLLIVCIGVGAVRREEQIFNNRQPLPVAGDRQHHQISGSTPKINDAEYWENDDFVPYKFDRHDEFDWKLLRTLFLKEQGNVVVSPFSIKLVLALLEEAAGQESVTQKELALVLPRLRPPFSIRDYYRNILKSLNEESVDYDLKLGTKIFLDNFIVPQQRYASILQLHYNAEIEKLDFYDADTSASIINNWCVNITSGHISNLVSPNDLQNAVMLVLNAIYFDGLWRKPFLENNTSSEPFFTRPSTNVKADFLTQTNRFYYFESVKLNSKIIRLPYLGKKFAMTIVLPNAKGGLEELIRDIEGDSLKRLQWLMDETQVKVSIPKFKFETVSNLKGMLKDLGINDIFTTAASLPGLARGAGLQNRLQVSDIIQKAGIIVHETGSTAYAATEVTLINKFGGSTMEEFIANRPFLFFIEDETTGTMLFAGKISDPSK